ncbi:IS30 family transposase [Pelagibacterium sp.]|uniref:IS30 family transposase n=1 Tax=Pelagibacterium sp. TaxID=1967288 RepID=UPI003BA84C28
MAQLKDKISSAIVAVSDIERARKFYSETLGLELEEDGMGGVLVYKTGSTYLLVYPSDFAGTNKANAVVFDCGGDIEATVVAALADRIGTLPEELRRSLTWDQGKEMARHKSFTIATDLQVYFCDPRSPWQRGSNENTNGLLRQYFPRATNFSQVSQAQLDEVALRLNQRPRKTLDFETPANRLHKVLQ